MFTTIFAPSEFVAVDATFIRFKQKCNHLWHNMFYSLTMKKFSQCMWLWREKSFPLQTFKRLRKIDNIIDSSGYFANVFRSSSKHSADEVLKRELHANSELFVNRPKFSHSMSLVVSPSLFGCREGPHREAAILWSDHSHYSSGSVSYKPFCPVIYLRRVPSWLYSHLKYLGQAIPSFEYERTGNK